MTKLCDICGKEVGYTPVVITTYPSKTGWMCSDCGKVTIDD